MFRVNNIRGVIVLIGVLLSWLIPFPAQAQSFSVSVRPGALHKAVGCRYIVGMSTPVSGTISSNTTWTAANSPYIVNGNITVNNGVTLTVDPCAIVQVNGSYKITVNGTFNAIGTAAKTITFTSNQSTPAPGDWQGLFFANPSNDANTLSYVQVNYASIGISIESSSPAVTHSTLKNNTVGIKLYKLATSNILDNVIDNNQYGIQIFADNSILPAPIIHNNLLLNNSLFDVFTGFTGINFNLGGSIIDARYNWWGTNNPATISASIWDHSDNAFRPVVNFSPFLEDPATTISILDNSVINKFFDPNLSQSSTINYYINQNANITIRIYDWQTQALVRTLINNQPRNSGTNAEVFNGKNDSNQALPEGVYIYKITAQSGTKTGSYDPVFFSGIGSPAFSVNVTPAGTFSPFKGDRLKVQYDLIEPALVSIGFTNYADFVSQKPRDLTGNVDYWDGRDSNGNINNFDNTEDILIKTEKLPVNLIVIQNRPTLDVTLLKTDPYAIRPLYNEVTEITYTTNQTADVTVKVLTEDGAQVIKILEQANSKSAGTYTLTWDGKKASGETINASGDYRVRVEAVSATGGTKIRDGNIRVLF